MLYFAIIFISFSYHNIGVTHVYNPLLLFGTNVIMKFSSKYHKIKHYKKVLKAQHSRQPEKKEGEGCPKFLPPPPLLKLPWRESALSHTNGYSIAEILLVFGIIAGVLIGVWAIYTMLAEESDARTVIAEIEMIRSATVQYKHATGQNQYLYSDFPGGRLDQSALVPYLGQSGLADGRNVFGERIFMVLNFPIDDLIIAYPGVPSFSICRKVLSRFGVVTDFPGYEAIDILKGDAIRGYKGSNLGDTSCERDSLDLRRYTIAITID